VIHSRLIRFAAVLLLCLGSLLLLSYVGFAETGRIYPKLRCDRIKTLTEVAAAPEWDALDGEKLAALLLLADKAISSVGVSDAQGRSIAVISSNRGDASPAKGCDASAPITRGMESGILSIQVDERAFDAALHDRFVPVLTVVIAAAFFVFMVQIGGRPGSAGRRHGSLAVAAGLTVVGAMLIATAFATLGGAVLDRTAGGVELANLLAAELGHPSPLQADVQRSSTTSPAFTVAQRVIGEDVVSGPDGTAAVAATATWMRVAGAIIPKMRNFAVLLLAGGLLGWILMGAGMAIVRAGGHGNEDKSGDGKLLLVKPAYFLAIFIDSLALSFLSSFTTEAAVAGGYQASAGSIPFTIFFLCLTIAQVPTGRYAERGNLKLLMMAGVGFTVAGLLILGFAPGFEWICVGRGLAGIGQGSLYIAMQNYALAVSPPERRTQAAAIQFAGASGGMISGTAIGGLLAVSIPVQQIFLLSAAVGVATVGYMILLVANVQRNQDFVPGSFLQDLRGVMSDGEFVRTLVLISILSKFVLVGVVFFAMPLVLHQIGYGKDLIAQIMMIYAVTNLFVTLTGAKLVDRLKSARLALFLGTVASGLGLALFGAATWTGAATGVANVASGWFWVNTGIGTSGLVDDALILAAMILVGVSQGLIAAPSISHIVDTQIAERRGWAAVVSMHRLLERAGHVSGPLVMGWGMAATSGGGLSVGLVGVATISAGTLFIATVRHRRIKEASGGEDSADMSIVNSTHD
jgi:predicted MFS family arabinose efflux permease